MEAPEPEVDEQSHIVKLKCSSGEKWLPAVEINGEGVFIELNKEKNKPVDADRDCEISF